ncbi:ABC transporter ATP-binding protein [Botrimarina mediterranea]|uniref:Putative ABC transporter ATP-binding protein YbhF n=1 Tax=Botrimarina mediterranea TaxID=2528022 RepID=A0A518KDM6_9BACT|nr:ABC transporter ATP-binding protein [Botrimarina mediterranea]QDV75898.1 putative ABC transporter ATP-binding protein YbhF [Botrimarina mediterranea]QDV80493.1 putative ABC transporter ATP-binding protein YbhF [Planctomycetes bacterium K2D]
MIEIRNFGKHYGDFVAVENLNLSIGKGELFGFIGPNGAGKSTTIRFLATLLRPTHGEATVAGHSVTDDPIAVRRSIGYMPDMFGVYDGMKVWEFLDFFAVAYEVPRNQRKAIIGDVLELLDLTHKRDDYVNGLSRGMKQRLCLAKTLVHDPPVLILDEPASGLDPRARLEVKALLKELRKMGKTILISSHILTELADICTSIGIIERGKLLLHGPIESVYRKIQQHRRLEIRFTGDPAAGVSLVRSDPHVRSLQEGPRGVTIEYSGGETDVARLMQTLAAGQVGLVSFADKEPTLEDVFMMVTKGLVT